MSLPFGFSPFDNDYDSPYAHTNAAIRRQSKGNIVNTTGHTPTSSISGAAPQQQQQQQQQLPHSSSTSSSPSATRPASPKGSQVGLNELPVRRYSPPPGVPSAEEFGSRRFSKSRAPSSSDQRPITQPQPIGPSLAAAWAQDNTTQQDSTSHQQTQSASASASPPSSPSQRRKPPPPPAAATAISRAASPPAQEQLKPSESPKASKAQTSPAAAAAAAQAQAPQQASPKASKKAAQKQQQRQQQQQQQQSPPKKSQSSRWSWMRSAAPAAAAATAATTAQDKDGSKSNAAPTPAAHDLPEPTAPPAPEQVALATPADAEAEASSNVTSSPAKQAQPAQEMQEIATYPSPSTPDSPASPVSHHAHGSQSRTSLHSHKSSHASKRAPTAAAAGLGAAAAATTAAATSSSTPAHTAYNMGDYSTASPFSEKAETEDNPRAPLAGGAGAASVLPTSNKTHTEGSRFSNFNSYSAAGAGAGAGSGGALSRSWRNHKKAWIIGIIIALIVIIAAAVGGAVGGNSSSSSGGSKGTTNGGGNGQDKGTGSGGTGIQPNSKLHNSFYGINYVPFESLAPACGANLTGVMDDLKLVSQLTTRVRLAGSACNETAMVLDAIERLDVDLTVFPAIVVDEDTTLTSTAWTNQVDLVLEALSNFGTSRVGGVQVGEEFVTRFGSQATLSQFITAFRTALAGNAGSSGVLVGTAETSSTWSESLAELVDFVFANNQAWYSGIAIEDAAGWTANYFQENVVDLVEDASTAPKAYISETGWPTGAGTPAQATLDASVASVANLQTYLDTFVCAANSNGTGYFFFEMFDDPNQDNAAGGVGGHWGLFDNQKKLKAITLPDCKHS
ncbi:unnamed protein product [Sympodiomycopsis kandeliae]